MRVWLRERGLEPELTHSEFRRVGHRDFSFLAHRQKDGDNFFARLDEKTKHGTWRTELTFHCPPRGDGWFLLDVQNSEDRFVDVPRLARYVMGVVETRDGQGILTPAPEVITENGVDALIDRICDPDRQGLVLIAGTDRELDFDSFTRRVARWTAQVGGLGQVIVLDPLATPAYAAQVGRSHAVPAWTIRSFLPDVDPASETDSRRHKILGTARLAETNDKGIEGLLGRSARAHASARTLPPRVIKIRRTFARLQDGALLEQLAPPHVAATAQPRQVPLKQTPRPRPAPRFVPRPAPRDEEPQTLESPAEDNLLARITSALGVAELTEASLAELSDLVRAGRAGAAVLDRVGTQLTERQQRIDELEDNVGVLRSQFEQEEFEHALAEEARGRLADENRWLRRRLAELEEYQLAYAPVPDEALTAYPGSFEDLLDRFPELEPRGVVFTGDRAAAADLDDLDSLGKLVRSTWDALLVLADYVAARASGTCTQGVDGYLQNTPDGLRGLPPKKHASKETRRTMEGWGNERVFPVPGQVSSTGFATMEAHFKLGRVGMASPRLYYLDRWVQDQVVYVGYIGTHLSNTKTN